MKLNWSKFLGNWCVWVIILLIAIGAILIGSCEADSKTDVVHIVPHRSVKGYVITHSFGVDTVFAEECHAVSGWGKGYYKLYVDDTMIAHYPYSLRAQVEINVRMLNN